MALALFTPITKNRKSFTSNLLLNSLKVVSFMKDEQYPLTRTKLFYNMLEGERGTTYEFILSHYINTVSTRLFEDETNKFIWIDVISYQLGSGREKATSATQSKWKINSDQVLYAYDIDSSTSYIYLMSGLNVMKIKTSHVVADLSRAFSTSSSLSAS